MCISPRWRRVARRDPQPGGARVHRGDLYNRLEDNRLAVRALTLALQVLADHAGAAVVRAV